MPVTDWTISGAQDLPIHGNTHRPSNPTPRAVAVIAHGWTGSKDRNIIPVLAAHAASLGLIAHRFSFGHCGIEKDADIITRHDEFARDSLAFQFADLRAVIEAIHTGVLPGKGLPLVLMGHSRGGATVLGASARARRERWPIRPAAVIAVAAPAAYTRLTQENSAELQTRGYVEKKLARAQGGAVRMGPSWYEHYTNNPGRDLFAEDLREAQGPILLIHGDADDAVPPEQAQRILKLLEQSPHARPRFVPIRWGDHNLGAVGFGVDHKRANKPAMTEARRVIEDFLNEVL